MEDLGLVIREIIEEFQAIALGQEDRLLQCVSLVVLVVVLILLLLLVRRFRMLQASLSDDLRELADKIASVEKTIGVTSSGEWSSQDQWSLGEKNKEASSEEPKKKTERHNLDISSDRETREPAKSSVFSGLEKTRNALFSRFDSVFSQDRPVSKQLYDELEELLVTSDLGVGTTRRLLEALKAEASGVGEFAPAQMRSRLKQAILDILEQDADSEIPAEKIDGKPRIVLVVGVNGVGKTTTVGKLAKKFAEQGAAVVIGACDTFRAAAVEQLEIWAKRAGAKLVTAEAGAKPSTVAFKAVHDALEAGADVVIIDTAGRLHTKVNLMNELKSVISIVSRELPGAPHEVLLVLDACTGQNALQQAREFHDKGTLTGLAITKLDGTPKGGIVVAIKEELGIPIRYVGVGEGIEDLKPFNAAEFVDAMFDQGNGASANFQSKRGKVKRNRAYQSSPTVT